MDFVEEFKRLSSSDNLFIDSAEWEDDWDNHFVIFVDLIAFANRCLISTGVTLNNIIRFHRAVNEALDGLDDIKKYQFTDACYILTKDAKTSLVVASNIQNECLLYNYSILQNYRHTMFHHLIVPKVVISKGNVLSFKNQENINSLNKLAGISANELLAGEGIVKAYYLEKRTTGGLVSVDKECINSMKRCGAVNNKIKTVSLYKKWKNDKENKLLSHDSVIDIPWLVLQPKQTKKGLLQIENVSSFKEKLLAFNRIWRTSFTEHLAEGTSTETLKQYGGGISHLCELMKSYLDIGPRSWDLVDLNNAIDEM